MFDIRAYADQHRYRVRNLHDGGAVPPVKQRGQQGQAPAYRGVGDRDDAIICRCGFVHVTGHPAGRLGVTVICASARALTARLAALRDVGVMISQLGDTEAVGNAPISNLAPVLAALRPYRRREAPGGARLHERQAVAAAG